MGAIAIRLSREGPAEPFAIRRTLAAAPHRGDRVSVEVSGQVALGVCNDPERITATLAREDGRMVAFCGTLDNDADLRADLRREGATEPGESTRAATVLAAFAQWGEDAVRRLRGQFAGVVANGHELKCFRDQFGARPLFCHDGPSGFFAATEVKQVLAGAGLPREPDLDYLQGVLFGGLDRSTAYRGVERIPKQVIASIGPRPGLTYRRYWDPSSFVETTKLGPQQALEGVREALKRAVRRCLSGRDVVLLSGGLDSPAVAAFAANAEGLTCPVQALTAIYPNHPSVDERQWTRLAAHHVGMPLREHVAEAGSLDDIEYWVSVLDGPVDVLSIPELSEFYTTARTLGARTVLNGEIAEMLFSSRSYLLDHFLAHGRLRAATREMGGLRRVARRPLRSARRIVRAIGPARLVTSSSQRVHPRLRGLPAWVDGSRLTWSDPGPPIWSLSPRRRWIEIQTAPFIGAGISFEADEICAEICGVDSRRPFTDVDLWEFVLGLPAEVKFPGRRTKPLLREAMRGLLPDELIDRKDKTYFDEFHLAKADYPTLERLLVDPAHRLEGIDYGLLRDRLRARDMRVYELLWARNVARVQAFLNQW